MSSPCFDECQFSGDCAKQYRRDDHREGRELHQTTQGIYESIYLQQNCLVVWLIYNRHVECRFNYILQQMGLQSF